MSSAENPALATVARELEGRNIAFAFAHESALMAWGMDANVFLSAVDVLVIDANSFAALGCVMPDMLGSYTEVKLAGVPTRLWSRKSLGLNGEFDVTRTQRYKCDCLCPETVLAKLPYSPDSRLLSEQRARLAATINAKELTDEELGLLATLVRGV